jgi:hypothetical protein
MSDSDKDSRFFPRYYTIKLPIEARLLRKSDLTEISGAFVDVSRDGIGYLSDQREIPGQAVILKLEKRKIEFQIMYCTADLLKPDQFRLGLKRQGSQENLVNLFQSHGFIEDEVQ